jgi:hypothetical protein
VQEAEESPHRAAHRQIRLTNVHSFTGSRGAGALSTRVEEGRPAFERSRLSGHQRPRRLRQEPRRQPTAASHSISQLPADYLVSHKSRHPCWPPCRPRQRASIVAMAHTQNSRRLRRIPPDGVSKADARTASTACSTELSENQAERRRIGFVESYHAAAEASRRNALQETSMDCA